MRRTKREIKARVDELVIACLRNKQGYTETEEDPEEVMAAAIVEDWYRDANPCRRR